MGILIKDATMPKCCNGCFWINQCQPHAERVQELLEKERKDFSDILGYFNITRLEGCPLIEIETEEEEPKHKGTIDDPLPRPKNWDWGGQVMEL